MSRIHQTGSSPDAAQDPQNHALATRRLEHALAVKWRLIDRVRPYERNPRLAPEAAVAKVAASLAEFGWRQPIVVDEDGVIIAGHTRLLAAKSLGLSRVPVHVASGLSPAQVKAYRLADNRTAEETTWDLDLLPTEIGELATLGYDLDLLAFDGKELARLTAEPREGLCDPDEAPEPPDEPVTQPGDLWQLGEHRLLCGDATRGEDVQRLMAGRRAALMATDPPYLVDYDGGTHPPTKANGGKSGKAYEKEWDAYVDAEHSTAFYARFLAAASEHALVEAPALYQWFGMTRVECVLAAWREAGLLAHQVLIWKKSRAVLTYSEFLWDYEPMLYGWKRGKRPDLRPPADTKAVWEIESRIDDGAAGVHPTQKPIETIRRPITYHTTPGGLIYEPFAGSGTALIAAEELGRVCYALELSPEFCDVVVARWERFTGRKAVRNG
jgi:DNA modification methylase